MSNLKITQGGRIRQSFATKAGESRPDGTPVELVAGVLQTYAGGGGPVYLALETAVANANANANGNTKTIVAGALGAALMDIAIVEIAYVNGTAPVAAVTFAEHDTVYANAGLLTNTSGVKIGFALPGTTATKLVMQFIPSIIAA